MTGADAEQLERPLPLAKRVGWRIWQRGAATLRIVCADFPRDTFLLMLPECLLDGRSGYFFWCSELTPSAMWRAHDAGRAVRVAAQPDAAEYQTILTCHAGMLMLSLSVRNLSEERWHRAAGVVCLRLSQAPNFADGELVRTYMRSGGEFVRLADTDRSYGNPSFSAYLCGGIEPPAGWKQPDSLWTARREIADEGFVATVARDGSGVAAVCWEPAHDIGCNASEQFRCIHANPLVGDLGPGETVTCRGCICVLKGAGVEDAYERCRSAMAGTERG